MSRILVVGSSNTDIVMKVPHLPRPGETITGTHMQVVQGGKGANQAVAAARMGVDTVFVASLGEDSFGAEALRGYKQDSIDTRWVVRSGEPTGTALIHIDDAGENCISINPGANGQLTPDKIDERCLADVSLVLLQLEVPIPTVLKVVEMASQRGIRIILNPAPAAALNELDFSKLFLFTPNETETEYYTGLKVTDAASAQIACDALHDKGCQQVIITMGSQGVYHSSAEAQGLIAGRTVRAVDTTAAGDVFNGALAAGWAMHGDLKRAIQLGQAAAALSVTKLGAQPSIPTRAEVQEHFGV